LCESFRESRTPALDNMGPQLNWWSENDDDDDEGTA